MCYHLKFQDRRSLCPFCKSLGQRKRKVCLFFNVHKDWIYCFPFNFLIINFPFNFLIIICPLFSISYIITHAQKEKKKKKGLSTVLFFSSYSAVAPQCLDEEQLVFYTVDYSLQFLNLSHNWSFKKFNLL